MEEKERITRLETLLEMATRDISEIKIKIEAMGQCQTCDAKKKQGDGLKYIVAGLAGAALMVKEIRDNVLSVLGKLFP